MKQPPTTNCPFQTARDVTALVIQYEFVGGLLTPALRDFVEEAKASGLIARLIGQHKVTGLSVAPPATPASSPAATPPP